jgi:hypothetical protein
MGNIFSKYKKKYYKTSNYDKIDKNIEVIYCGDIPIVISLDNVKKSNSFFMEK